MSGPGVTHDPARERFSTTLDGHEAFLEYAVVDDSTVDFRRTFSPPELRGRGVAAVVVRAAVDWARAEGKTIVPTCSYVARFLEREAKGKDA